ncbi:MAG: TadA family conjugal transfer-associated ATPase [Propionibacteriaceae bacterium]|nr:TadA family conjugal transfer-associated ATPase [Propionibacteriaceae bacterium]
MSVDTVQLVKQDLAARGDQASAVAIAASLQRNGLIVSDAAIAGLVQAISQDAQGMGPLEPLMAVPGLTDILVNGADQVVIDSGQGLIDTGIHFADDDAVRQLASRLAASVGRRLDDGSPFVDARLANGVRFHAVLAGIATPGTCLSLRIPARRTISFEQWEGSGGIDAFAGRVLRRVIEKKVAFLITGGTGSGKTTLLGAMLGLVPEAERLVIVEDSRELQPDHPHVVSLESRPANAEGVGMVSMADLVRQGLRMRPDRLVVGEVRGIELRDLLQALNTGHEGGCGTIHANSTVDLPARLEALGALAGLGRAAMAAQTLAAIKLVIHVTRQDGSRQVSQLALIEPDGQGGMGTQLAWRRDGSETIKGEALASLMDLLA